jgi:hypothetical protein
MENKFNVDGVLYTATGEYLSSENDLKAAAKDCSEHELLQHSAEFLTERNSIIEAFHNGKLSLLQYATLLTDSDKLREKLPHDVVTMRTFSTEIEDDIGMMQKVTFQGKIEIEELPAPSLMEGYETHAKGTLGKDELTVLTIKRYIAHRQKQIGSPSPYSNQTEYEAWLKTINLKNDSKTVSEFIDAIAETAKKFAFVTDEGENLQADVLSDLPDIKAAWEKKAAVPSMFPGEQTADTRLLVELQDLAKEAYMVAQRVESKKGEPFLEQLKGLFKRHEAVLLTPEDAKHEAI